MTATTGGVRLSVPAAAGHLRMVRLVAASVASDHGFDDKQVDEIRVAVDELCVLLLADRAEEPAEAIHLEFDVFDTELEVRGHYDGNGRIGSADWLVEEILTGTADEFQLPTDADPAFRYLRRRETCISGP